MSALRAVAELTSPGGAIRERRVELGWTQAELAARSGVTQGDVSRIENGRLDARWSTINRLSAVLAAEEPPRRSLANGGRRARPKPEPANVWAPSESVLEVGA